MARAAFGLAGLNIVCLSATGAALAQEEPAKPVVAAESAHRRWPESVGQARERFYTYGAWRAPGLRFGNRSQELQFTLGAWRTDAASGEGARRGGTWSGFAWRGGMIATGWVPRAGSLTLVVNGGGWSWEWWPVGFEAGFGVAGNLGKFYGVGQVSYVVGRADVGELFVSRNFLLGPVERRPSWMSDWMFGVRYPLPIGGRLRERVRFEPVSD